jgi:hypothetical protein
MIQLNEFPFPLIEVYSPEGNCIGNITSGEMLADLQLQICKEKAVGWALHWNDQVIPIDSLGQFNNPVGMADIAMNKLIQIIKERNND